MSKEERGDRAVPYNFYWRRGFEIRPGDHRGLHNKKKKIRMHRFTTGKLLRKEKRGEWIR